MKLSINDFFSQSDQIRSFLRIRSHLLNKSLMENFIFYIVKNLRNYQTTKQFAQRFPFLIFFLVKILNASKLL